MNRSSRAARLAARLAALLASFAPAQSAFSAPPVFRDVAALAGVTFVHETGFDGRYFFPEIVGGGCAVFDFDGDGFLDLFFVNGGALDPPRAPLHALYRNRGDGTFEDVSRVAGIRGSGYGQGCAVADFDADGDSDLLVTNVGGDQLFRNDGGGAFADVTRAAGLGEPGWSTSAAFADLDGDEDLDLFVARYCLWSVAGQVPCRSAKGEPDYCNPSAFEPAPCAYYRNRGDGAFEDATREAGFDAAYGHGLGVLVDDFDGDGDPDVYVANDGDANNVWMNDGAGRFTDAGLISGAALDEAGNAEAGMGVTAADLDDDGACEILVTNMVLESNTLYANDGGGFFRDATVAWGLDGPSMPFTGFGARFFDADLDGDADLAVANGAVIKGDSADRGEWPYAQRDGFYVNEGGRFHALSPAEAAWLESTGVGRGLALGDLDRDGDVDLVESRAGGAARVLRNDTPRSGRWVGVRLRQDGANPEAIGAVVSLDAGARRGRQRVTRGESYASASDARLVFAVGDGGAAIEVRWPNGTVETWEPGPVDRDVVLVRGTGKRAPKDAPRAGAANAAREASPAPSRPQSAPPSSTPARGGAASSDAIPELPSLAQVDEDVAARIRASRAAVVAHPEDAAAWKEYGVGLTADLAADAAATDALRRATALDSTDARSIYLLALLAEKTGDAPDQRARLERTLVLAPAYGPARLRLSRLDLAEGNRSGAEAAARTVLASDSTNAFAWLSLSRVHRESGRLDDAERCAARATELAPDARAARYERGLVARARGDLETARRELALAESLPEDSFPDPWLADLHAGRGGDSALLTEGNRLRRSGSLERAHEHFRAYVEKRPEDAIGWANLAAVSRDLNRADEALEAANRAVALDAARAEAWALRGTLLAARGERAAAVESLEHAVALRPELAPAWLDLGTLHKDAGANDRARICFERYVRLNPADPQGTLRLAEARLALNDFEGAAADLAQTLALDPANAVAHFRSGGLALRREAPAEAIPHFEAALSARPDWADAHFGLALAQRMAGRPEAALAAVRRALELDPTSERFHRVLAELEGR